MRGRVRMAKRKQDERNKKQKVERSQEEKLATAGGFLIAGGYLLYSKELPTDLMEWGKFIGIFIVASLVLFLGIHYGKKLLRS